MSADSHWPPAVFTHSWISPRSSFSFHFLSSSSPRAPLAPTSERRRSRRRKKRRSSSKRSDGPKKRNSIFPQYLLCQQEKCNDLKLTNSSSSSSSRRRWWRRRRRSLPFFLCNLPLHILCTPIHTHFIFQVMLSHRPILTRNASSHR